MKRIALTVTNCDNCGACCTEQAALPIHMVNPRVALPSVRPLPEALKQELRELTAKFMATEFPEGNCIWYDTETRRCRHYEYRPITCRDEVKPGDESCLRWRRDKGIDPNPKYRYKKGKIVKS